MKVKRLILLPALYVVLLFSGCVKSSSCDPNPPYSESSQILAYASANGMNMTGHPSGLYYEIVDMGTGPAPTDNSNIVITYTGKMLNGTIIDYQPTPNPSAIPLSSFVEGWRIALPLIKRGGHIRIIVPSALAYGCQEYRGLPGNTIIFYDIDLVDVQ
jgi:FKBP-type peptidyl-prolyl cis-trans isomerase FkpA